MSFDMHVQVVDAHNAFTSLMLHGIIEWRSYRVLICVRMLIAILKRGMLWRTRF